MIRVTIELDPGGIAARRRTIASMTVGSVSCLADIVDYRVNAMEAANPLTGVNPRSATCVVARHDRRQSVWTLVAKAADEITRSEFDEL
jgi:hypothetical protein